jgi:hypothetical protein
MTQGAMPPMPLLYFEPDPDMTEEDFPREAQMHKDASKSTLSDVYENEECRGSSNLMYEYDMGDGWKHVINFVGVEDPGLRKALMLGAEYDIPLCVAGEVCVPSS